MTIYTRNGDGGSTTGPAGQLPKDHVLFDALGGLDELGAQLGLALTEDLSSLTADILEKILPALFEAGGQLWMAAATKNVLGRESLRELSIELESAIDRWDKMLPPLKGFIIQGGSKAAAHLHLARTVCRRAERRAVRALRDIAGKDDCDALRFLNRLSDFLFTAARFENHRSGSPEILKNSD